MAEKHAFVDTSRDVGVGDTGCPCRKCVVEFNVFVNVYAMAHQRLIICVEDNGMGGVTAAAGQWRGPWARTGKTGPRDKVQVGAGAEKATCGAAECSPLPRRARCPSVQRSHAVARAVPANSVIRVRRSSSADGGRCAAHCKPWARRLRWVSVQMHYAAKRRRRRAHFFAVITHTATVAVSPPPSSADTGWVRYPKGLGLCLGIVWRAVVTTPLCPLGLRRLAIEDRQAVTAIVTDAGHSGRYHSAPPTSISRSVLHCLWRLALAQLRYLPGPRGVGALQYSGFSDAGDAGTLRYFLATCHWPLW